MKLIKQVFTIFIVLAFTGCHSTLKPPAPQELRQVPYLPQDGTSAGGGKCFLCFRGPQEDDSLAFLSINAGSISFVELSQDTEDEAEKTSGYTTISWSDHEAAGCTIQSQTYPKSGLFTGQIWPGETPAPQKSRLKRNYCPACRQSLKQVLDDYDMVLVDTAEHNLYNICNGDYRFDIRNYAIRTIQKQDGTIIVEIFNSETGQDKRPDWV